MNLFDPTNNLILIENTQNRYNAHLISKREFISTPYIGSKHSSLIDLSSLFNKFQESLQSFTKLEDMSSPHGTVIKEFIESNDNLASLMSYISIPLIKSIIPMINS